MHSGEDEVINLLRQFIESQGRLWQEVRALQDVHNALLQEVRALRRG